MSNAIAKRDQNSVPVLTGITDDASQEIRMLLVDPDTGRLLVSGIGGGGGGGSLVIRTVSGTIDGVNVDFTIPSPITSGKSFIDLNGQVMVQDTDYTVSGTHVTYVVAPGADLSGVTHKIVYAGGTATSLTLGETPSGTVNGVNLIFTVGASPSSLVVYADGLRQVEGVSGDYTSSGVTITFNAGRAPFSSISCDYFS